MSDTGRKSFLPFALSENRISTPSMSFNPLPGCPPRPSITLATQHELTGVGHRLAYTAALTDYAWKLWENMHARLAPLEYQHLADEREIKGRSGRYTFVPSRGHYLRVETRCNPTKERVRQCRDALTKMIRTKETLERILTEGLEKIHEIQETVDRMKNNFDRNLQWFEKEFPDFSSLK